MENVAEAYEKELKGQSSKELSDRLKYIKAYKIVRRMYLSGQFDEEVLERLNKRNAEQLNCVAMDFRD